MRALVIAAALSFPLHLVAVGQAEAASLDLVPSTPGPAVGSTLDVEIVIAGLGEGDAPSLSAFDITISFDATLLALSGVSFGPLLGDPTNPLETMTSMVFGVDSVNLAEVSNLFPSDLDTLQPDSFSLATLSFMPIAPGTSQLTLSEVVLGDAFGLSLTVDALGTATISSVPEPTVFPLMIIAGAFALGLARPQHRFIAHWVSALGL